MKDPRVVLVCPPGSRCMVAAGPLSVVIAFQDNVVNQGQGTHSDYSIMSTDEYLLDCERGQDGVWRPIAQ